MLVFIPLPAFGHLPPQQGKGFVRAKRRKHWVRNRPGGKFLSCTKAKFRNEGEKEAHFVALHRCLRRDVVMIF